MLEVIQKQILILGLGNILIQDEGLGVRALERLKTQHTLPEPILTLDGGTMGLNLLPYLIGVTDLLIINAVNTGEPPGTIIRLEGEDIPSALSLKMSMHQVGLQELLAAGRFMGSLPEHIVLLGMQPASIEWSDFLSPLVAPTLDNLVSAVIHELSSWGVSVN
jgi:hydrogenase maturation protease